jgi:hypothetical protein
MMVATARISDSVQTLIDSRLDTIDRMLLGRLSRQDRLAIVREVESQIHELIQARDADELTREHVLAVLARLDPPEAYLPDETEGDAERVSMHKTFAARTAQPEIKGDVKVGRASGILGLAAIVLLMLLPVTYTIAIALKSELAFIVLGGGNLLLVGVAAALGLVLGVVARKSRAWAIVGIVTSVLAPVLALAILAFALLLS